MKTASKNPLCLHYERGFPVKGTVEERLKFLAGIAEMSPSLGRSSPWRFEVQWNQVVLHLDASRARRATDPDSRELVISCGMALEHLCVAAQRFRHEIFPNLLPDGFPGPLVEAGLRVGKSSVPGIEDLFGAIFEWATPALGFAEKSLTFAALEKLLKQPADATSDFFFRWNNDERLALAGLIAEGDRLHQRAEEARLAGLGPQKRSAPSRSGRDGLKPV